MRDYERRENPSEIPQKWARKSTNGQAATGRSFLPATRLEVAVMAAEDRVPVIVDRLTGQVRAAQIFVAVMGTSNFTYAEATIPT